MSERTCPGLPADWLNGWLAAVGAICLAPDLRLRWSDDPVPLAVLVADGAADPSDVLARAWPSSADVAAWPIARHLDGHAALPLNPTVDAWRDRARLARESQDSWMLSSLFTDLAFDAKARDHVIAKGGLHTPMPGRDNTVHDRVRKLVAATEPSAIESTLDGVGSRIANYGLGFDLSRIGSLADEATQMVDPVVEILAFHALSLFPQRGDDRPSGLRRNQRGWSGKPVVLRWWTWSEPLTADAIDALLDAAAEADAVMLGLTGGWRTCAFEARGTSDVTRGFGSEALEGPWARRS